MKKTAQRSLLVFPFLLGVSAAQDGSPPAAPAEKYQEQIENYLPETVRGFEVHVHRSMAEREPDLLTHVLLLLEHDLAVMEEVLPAPAFGVLRSVPVWIELQGAVVEGGMSGRGMCFHVSMDWLTSHGLLGEKTGGVEIVRAVDFSVWRRSQPFMTFHEFSHAYHHLVGVSDGTIIAAYDAAMAAGLYDSVDRNSTTEPEPAYAMTNHIEYFAELSEAYFGLNDFFPFSRNQLAEYDPAGFAAVEALWNLSADDISSRVALEAFPRDDRPASDGPETGPPDG